MRRHIKEHLVMRKFLVLPLAAALLLAGCATNTKSKETRDLSTQVQSLQQSVTALQQQVADLQTQQKKLASLVIAAQDPHDLYTSLLNTPVAPEELPQGFTAPRVWAASAFLNDLTKSHDVIGEIDLVVDGPDTAAQAAYLVFPSPGKAKAVFDLQAPEQGAQNPSTFTPTGMDVPAKCFSFGRSGGSQPVGVTICDALVGSVEVTGYSQLAGNAQHGNNDSATALLKAAVEHMQKVQQAG
jgi:outer membrane murein-binding lipoprotein Lpp